MARFPSWSSVLKFCLMTRLHLAPLNFHIYSVRTCCCPTTSRNKTGIAPEPDTDEQGDSCRNSMFAAGKRRVNQGAWPRIGACTSRRSALVGMHGSPHTIRWPGPGGTPCRHVPHTAKYLGVNLEVGSRMRNTRIASLVAVSFRLSPAGTGVLLEPHRRQTP